MPAQESARYVNPANAITASRYLTLLPFFLWMQSGDIQLAWLMVCVSVLADVLDGPAARYFNCASGFGELFDAITDGICYGFYIAVAAYFGIVPVIPIVIFIALGVLNSVLRGIYTKRAGRATNFRSWAMERIAAYAALLAGAAVTGYSATFYAWGIPVIMGVVVLWDAKRMLFDPIPPAAVAEPSGQGQEESTVAV